MPPPPPPPCHTTSCVCGEVYLTLGRGGRGEERGWWLYGRRGGCLRRRRSLRRRRRTEAVRRRGGLRGGLVPAGRGEFGRCGRPPALWRRGRLAGGGGREQGGGEGTSRAAAALALAARRCTLSCVEVATEAAGGSSSGGGGGSISGSVGGSGAVECRRSLYDDVAREGATVAARDVVGRGGLGLVALKRISPGTLGWAWASASTVCCLPSTGFLLV